METVERTGQTLLLVVSNNNQVLFISVWQPRIWPVTDTVRNIKKNKQRVKLTGNLLLQLISFDWIDSVTMTGNSNVQ